MPPFSIHVLPQRMEKMRLVGTVTMFFAAVNVMRVVPYFALGQLTRDNLMISAGADAARDRDQFPRLLAGAAHSDRAVLPHHLCADVPDLGRAAGAGRYRTVARLGYASPHETYGVIIVLAGLLAAPRTPSTCRAIAARAGLRPRTRSRPSRRRWRSA